MVKLMNIDNNAVAYFYDGVYKFMGLVFDTFKGNKSLPNGMKIDFTPMSNNWGPYIEECREKCANGDLETIRLFYIDSQHKICYRMFLLAAYKGYLDVILYFVKELDFFTRFCDEKIGEDTLLKVMCYGGNCNVIQWLLEYDKKIPKQSIDDGLVLASMMGHLDAVKLLINYGADIFCYCDLRLSQFGFVNSYHREGGMYKGTDHALIMAVMANKVHVVKFLVQVAMERGLAYNNITLNKALKYNENIMLARIYEDDTNEKNSMEIHDFLQSVMPANKNRI